MTDDEFDSWVTHCWNCDSRTFLEERLRAFASVLLKEIPHDVEEARAVAIAMPFLASRTK